MQECPFSHFILLYWSYQCKRQVIRLNVHLNIKHVPSIKVARSSWAIPTIHLPHFLNEAYFRNTMNSTLHSRTDIKKAITPLLGSTWEWLSLWQGWCVQLICLPEPSKCTTLKKLRSCKSSLIYGKSEQMWASYQHNNRRSRKSVFSFLLSHTMRGVMLSDLSSFICWNLIGIHDTTNFLLHIFLQEQ